VTRRGISRRTFIAAAGTATAVAAGVWAWRDFFGSSSSPFAEGPGGPHVVPSESLALLPSGRLLDTVFPDPFAGGTCIGYLPFLGEQEGRVVPGVRSPGGHNSRRIIDLASLLVPGSRNTPADLFYIRTEYPDLLSPPAEWTIAVHGAVENTQDLPLSKLQPLVEPRGSVLLECSGNAREQLQLGLLSVGDWDGIGMDKIISLAHPTSRAKAILIKGFDDDSNLPDHGPPYNQHSWPTCSWIFTFDQLLSAKAFLATRLNGAPLPRDQGAPVRLVVPGWYGCTEVKWVNEIKFVDNDQPATLQMLEFSDRTFQQTRSVPSFSTSHMLGPEMARDYRPATIDQAATAVRVEQWMLDGKIAYRITGITWGGQKRTNKLKIRFVPAGRGSKKRHPSPFEPVQYCAAATSNREYGIWCHRWEPEYPGAYWIELQLDASGIPSRKMSAHRPGQIPHFARAVFVPAV
jgi:DMSO/TMAO reductase YedYZ molybdopterin-dependent catalytic subunit